MTLSALPYVEESISKDGSKSSCTKNFLHHIVDTICKKSIPFERLYILNQEELTKANQHNQEDTQNQEEKQNRRINRLTKESLELQDVVKIYYDFFMCASGHKYDENKIQSILYELSNEYREIVHEVYLGREKDIRKALIQVGSTLNESYLEDFDYSVRIALSSNSISSYREPMVVLNLSTCLKDNSKKDIVLQLNKTELNDLLEEFNRINKTLSEISVS